jgi:secreted trypsin-like serine protease
LLLAALVLVAAVGPATAIVSGYVVPTGQLRYVARIMIDNAGTQSECTGTVVKPNVILTAAHCVVDPSSHRQLPPADFTVMTTGPDIGAGVTYPHQVLAITHFADYSIPTRTGDVALLQLTTPSTAHPVAVAGPADRAWAYAAGRALLVAGFGRTSPQGWGTYSPTLDAVQLQALTSAACAGDDLQGYPFAAASEFCGAVPASDQAICYGDSGGPVLATNVHGVVVEVGTTSYVSTESGACPPPSYFQRLASYAPWLGAQIVHLQLTSACPAIRVLSTKELAAIAQYRSWLRLHLSAGARRQVRAKLAHAQALEARYVASLRAHGCV